MNSIGNASHILKNSMMSGPRALLLAGIASFAAIVAAAQSQEQDVLRKARELQAHHQTEAATVLLRPYVAEHQQDTDSLTLLAQLRLEVGDKEEATRLLSAALTASPNSVEANLIAGKLLLSDHHDPEAMDRFETVLKIDLHNAEARTGEATAATDLAVSARGANHPDVALKVLEHACAKLPDDPKLLLSMGLEATELGQYPEAETSLHTAAQLKPHDPEIVYALARLDTERQHMKAAEEEFRLYLTMQPNDASAHFGLGHILAMTQRVDEARAEFDRSIQLQPVQTESYYQIGQLELDIEHNEKAEPLFSKVLARDPKHAGALTGMGILAFRAKDYAGAERYLAAAEESAPKYQPSHYYRGLVLIRLGRKAEGEEELHAAVELSRSDVPPR
jgi:Flp pilus assembly protein TadD